MSPCCFRTARRALLILSLVLFALTVASSATALPARFDFGDGPALTGWTGIDPAAPTGTNEGVQIVLSATSPSGFDDRDRGVGGNGGGAENDMWRDFIFAVPDPSRTDGLLLSLSGLSPDESYLVTVWSFDSAGSQVDSRISTWNGEFYSFTPRGGNPETLDDNFVRFQITADGTGLAQVLGDSLESGDPGVFINGMEIAIVPEPGTGLLLGMGLVSLAVQRRREKSGRA